MPGLAVRAGFGRAGFNGAELAAGADGFARAGFVGAELTARAAGFGRAVFVGAELAAGADGFAAEAVFVGAEDFAPAELAAAADGATFAAKAGLETRFGEGAALLSVTARSLAWTDPRRSRTGPRSAARHAPRRR